VAAFCNKCHLQWFKGRARFGGPFSAHIFLLTPAWSAFMGSSHMPPIPPANRTKKGPGSDPAASKDEPLKQPEHHHNAAEEGETANIKQNTTNKGFFRGRRQD
jgi:hypothetical protein